MLSKDGSVDRAALAWLLNEELGQVMSTVKHVLGISGGKDSAALAIYMKDKYPSLDVTYYFTDTGKELDETYQLIERLEGYLGKSIAKLESEDAMKVRAGSIRLLLQDLPRLPALFAGALVYQEDEDRTLRGIRGRCTDPLLCGHTGR